MEKELEILKQQMPTLETRIDVLVISNKNELTAAGDLLKDIKDCISAFTKKKKELIKPFKDGIENLKKEFDPTIEGGEALKIKLEAKMSDFHIQMIEDEKKVQEEIRNRELLRLEKLKEEAEAIAAKNNDTSALNVAIAIENKQEKLMETPVQVRKTVHGDYSSTGLSMPWTYEIINPIEVPREYCIPSPGLLRDAVNGGKREIPGVRIFQKPKITSR